MVERISKKEFEEWLQEKDNRRILVMSISGCHPCDELVDELGEREDEFEEIGYSVYFTKDKKVNKYIFDDLGTMLPSYPTVCCFYNDKYFKLTNGYNSTTVDRMLDFISDDDKVMNLLGE